MTIKNINLFLIKKTQHTTIRKKLTWKVDFEKWLYNNETNKKQFLMISLDDYYFEKYVRLCCNSKLKYSFSFYLNLLNRVNGVKNTPSNVALQPEYTACLSYSTLFNKCIPLSQLDEKAKHRGYKGGEDLFDARHRGDGITKQIKGELTEEYVIPYLEELQKIGLIKFEKRVNKNGNTGQQFYIKINNSSKTNKYDKHYDFLAVPFSLLFDMFKAKNNNLLAFISFFKAKKNLTKSQNNECIVEFQKIVREYKIDELFCNVLNLKKTDKITMFLADKLQEAFIEIMESPYLKQGDTIITDISDCDCNVENINDLKRPILVKLAETLDNKNDDLYDNIYNKLFYFTDDFIEKTTIIELKNKKQLIFSYKGKKIETINSAFKDHQQELSSTIRFIIKCYLNKDYHCSFSCDNTSTHTNNTSKN